MTDKKFTDFTDKEIESSLKVIATTRNCDECKIRNCKWGTCNCSQTTANAALDLINRQKVEIERLNQKVEKLSEVLSDTIRIRYAEAKSEAIKEFAERLKETSTQGFWETDAYVGVEQIDDLVKEIVGEEE